MDSTRCTLLLAMVAAFCAAFISGWLLRMIVAGWLFWAILAATLLCAPAGLFAPWLWSRQQRMLGVVPTTNIFSSTVLAVGASALLVFVERRLHPVEEAEQAALPGSTHTLAADQLLRTMIAVAGLGMAVSLICFLWHYTLMQESAELRRLCRRVLRLRWWAPKAKVLICESLEAAAPGECAVCLDQLAASSSALGVLRLPCGHTFHCECADRWMAREVNCPMCRQPIGSLSRCLRICLRQECCAVAEAFPAEAGKSPRRQKMMAEVIVEDCPEINAVMDLEASLAEGKSLSCKASAAREANRRHAQQQVKVEACHKTNAAMDLEACCAVAGFPVTVASDAIADSAHEGAAAVVAQTHAVRPGRQCFSV